jgi:hypothetical protein
MINVAFRPLAVAASPNYTMSVELLAKNRPVKITVSVYVRKRLLLSKPAIEP